jgi:hypothetical protein
VRSTETQRIRTATMFARASGGHSESALRSSVTKTAQLIVLQPSRSALTIPGKTLALSIATKKCTVVAWLALKQRTIVNVSPHPTIVSSSTTPVSLTSPTLRSPSTPNTGGNGGDAASSPALSAHESLQSASLNESYAIDLTPTAYSVHVNGGGEETEGGRETAACSCVRNLMRPGMSSEVRHALSSARV